MTEKELLKENTLLSKILLLEKAESKEEMMQMYSKIMNQDLSQTAIEKIENYIIIILSQVFKKDKKELEKVLKNFEGRKNKMMHIEEVLIRERKKDRAEARAEGIAKEKIRMIREMLLNKEQDSKIQRYANVSSKELDKIKKELLTQHI